MAPTDKQRQVYEALLFLRSKGEHPTVREVGNVVGLTSPATVLKHLKALEREGLITMSGKSRGIRIFPPYSPRGDGGEGTAESVRVGGGEGFTLPFGMGSDGSRARGIPLMGRIAAGGPIEAIAEAEPPLLSIAPDMFAESGDLMALKVAGESMIDAGILDGDYVIIRRQMAVEEGEVAAVQIDGEVTLKRWKTGRRPGREAAILRLMPANARFQPIEITEEDNKDVRVLGKYVGLVRGDVRFS